MEFDVVVIGSGAAGLTAALTAHSAGLSVLVLEKEKVFGGTTARSGGWLWIPLSPQAVAAGVSDSAEEVKRYLRACAGERYDEQRVDAYLAKGPEMVRFVESTTPVRFELGHDFPDYHPQLPGGLDQGRSIVAKQMSAHEMGSQLALLALPLKELSFLGMVIGSGTELKHFFKVTQSLRSAAIAARRLLGHSMDMLRHGRGMRLVNGNALAAGLGKAVLDRGIPLWLGSGAEALQLEAGRVTGVTTTREGQPLAIRARRAVVLATGGFGQDAELRRRHFPHTPTGREHRSLASSGNTGDGIRLGMRAGAAFEELPSAAAWVPVSRVPYRDAGEGLYPHFVDRGKPGVIAVRSDGQRFVNEGNSYHDFVSGLFKATPPGAPVRAFFIADHPTVRRYGLGVAKPFPVPLTPYLNSGYLKRAGSIEALAHIIGVDPRGLCAGIQDFNRHAARGADPVFGRGSTAYNRFQGDATRPHPSLAPVAVAPFYAVEVLPGSLGTYSGLRTDEYARVLDASGHCIDGLYAAGNDMASIMGGDYPGGGTTIGPAMTFGYIAGRHIAQAPEHAMQRGTQRATEQAPHFIPQTP